MNDSITSLLDYVSFTHEVRKVKRSMWVLDEDQLENDSEHGYQLALVALYIVEQNQLKLDPYKCMALALVHDILEIHAGDTNAYGSKSDLESKYAREQAAIVKLKKQWPQLTLMHELINEYEDKTTSESKFVYALDKLIPMLNNYLDNGRNWRREHITLDKIMGVKAGKVDIDESINHYYQELLELLKNKPELSFLR